MNINTLFRELTPAMPERGVHLDLKGLPPTPGRMVELLKLFAATRYNVVLVEWKDAFPWTGDERFRSPTAYTREEIARFVRTAADLGLELIPLVQCLGHMETPLSVPGHGHLRELPDNESGLNPLAPGARELIQNMVDDVLTLMPGVRHFHLGGDEARTFGENPETRAYVEAHGKGARYLHHIEPILDRLNSRGVRPILWHDMMIDWAGNALRALAVILHDGRPPTGGVASCVDALESVGERDRFKACRDVVQRLADLRREGWQKVQHARQVAVLDAMDPSRTSARNPKLGLHALVRLGSIVRRCDALAEEMRRCFAGLLAPVWIEEYLATRIEPLREELALIERATGAVYPHDRAPRRRRRHRPARGPHRLPVLPVRCEPRFPSQRAATQLRGANIHVFFPGLGNALSERPHRADMELMKRTGGQWARTALGEERYNSLKEGGGGLWKVMARFEKKAIVAEAKPVEMAALGTEPGEANESAENKARAVAEATVTDADKKVAVGANGVITIPAAVCPGSLSPMKSFLGGLQAFCGGDFRCEVEVPSAGTYAVTARVVTAHGDGKLQLTANNAGNAVSLTIPCTLGLGQPTEPVEVTLVRGRNMLSFAQPTTGFAFKDITLTPVR